MTIAVPENQPHGGQLAPHQQPAPAQFTDSPLVQWAYEADQAMRIADILVRSSFVPQSLRGKPADLTAAILAGQELGLQPMATLRSMDVIQGTPALRAHAMRGLVQSRGHEVELVESDAGHCVMRGRRHGSETWQTVTWTMARAQQMGLTTKPQWKNQPQNMLVARATGEICRLIAADVLYAMPYASEELDQDQTQFGTPTVTRVTGSNFLDQPEEPAPSAPQVPDFTDLISKAKTRDDVLKIWEEAKQAGVPAAPVDAAAAARVKELAAPHLEAIAAAQSSGDLAAVLEAAQKAGFARDLSSPTDAVAKAYTAQQQWLEQPEPAVDAEPADDEGLPF